MSEKSNIPHIPYKDFLKNQEPPKRTDKNYVEFWLKHINYCKSGVYVGGIFISGWLYWHMNFFKITIDEIDEYGNPVSIIKELSLRDNEWMIDYAFNKTDKDEKKPLSVVGTRRFAKTVFIASRLAYKAYVFQNSHIVIAGASATDINNITKYFDEFYNERPDCFSDLRKVGDWNRASSSDVEIAFSKREVLKKDPITKKAGVMNPITPHLINVANDNKYIYSRVAVRNLEHGQVKTKEELLAGITPTEVIWDESGKYLWEKQHEALLPALSTVYGKRATEVFVGTGGNVDFSADLEKAFLTPESIGFYHFDLEEYKSTLQEGVFKYKQKSDLEVGVFVPGVMSLEGGLKKRIPISEYVKKEYTKKELQDLEGLTIKITDWENAELNINKYLENSKNKSDAAYKKAQMYYPFQPEDCFMYSGNNPFPVEEAKKTQKLIREKGLTGEYVSLSQNEQGEVVITESSKKPCEKYPFEGGAYDAPVVIFERPIRERPEEIKRGSYVAGFDGYKISTSQTTDSLGAVYIYKRHIGLKGYQNQIVACLVTRPSEDKKFYRQVYLLLKMYNAELLPERDTNLYNYFKDINQLKYWANCKNLVQGLTPNSKADSTHGLPPTPANQEHILKLLQAYCNEEILVGYDEDDEPIYAKGVERITDIMLLEEIINYGKYKNFDRIIAFGHALAWAAEMGVYKIDGGTEDMESKPTYNKILQSVKQRNQNRWRM